MFRNRRGIACFTFAGLVALVLSAAAQDKPSDQEVLFEENFSTLDPTWGEPSEFIFVKDGKLTIRPDQDAARYLFYNGDLFEDMDASIKLRLADGNPNWGAGLIFWGEDNQNYYYVYLSATGRWIAARYIRGKVLTVIPWRDTDAVKKGVGETNELRVVTRGPRATIYANGTELATFQGRPPMGGSMIGVRADSGSDSRNTWEFDDLKVRKAPPVPTPSETAANHSSSVARAANKVPAPAEAAK